MFISDPVIALKSSKYHEEVLSRTPMKGHSYSQEHHLFRLIHSLSLKTVQKSQTALEIFTIDLGNPTFASRNTVFQESNNLSCHYQI